MRPRSPSLEEWRDEPFSPEAVAWRPGSSWTVGSSPWFVTAAAGPFLVERCILLSRMTVGAALSSAKCTFRRRGPSGEAGVAACGPCSLAGVPVVVVARPGAALPEACPGHRPARGALPGGSQRRGLSKSATKARIEPERARRIVDIPRFSSPPIPPRGAFAADFGHTPAPTHHRSPTRPTQTPQNKLPGAVEGLNPRKDEDCARATAPTRTAALDEKDSGRVGRSGWCRALRLVPVDSGRSWPTPDGPGGYQAREARAVTIPGAA